MDTPIAFYVVSEAEAKALMGNSGNATAGVSANNAAPTASKVMVDGNNVSFDAYNIGGNNYFKLRDVAKVLNIGVGYDTATKVITIDTKVDYTN